MGEIEAFRLFYEQIPEVTKAFPKLSKSNSPNGITILKGEVDLIDEFGIWRDSFDIEIHPTELFPYRFPAVFETGGKIPKNIDWHVFESSGKCCIRVGAEEAFICKNGISLIEFVTMEVLPYFFNQTFRRLNGFFIRERSHGLLGAVEFYLEKMREADIFKMIKYLEFICTCKEPGRTSLCFCGSGLKYRKCHRDRFRIMHSIGISIVIQDLTELKDVLNRH
ncbi:MAG: SEC-C domain-containing protein [Chitinophagaceae bacterium]